MLSRLLYVETHHQRWYRWQKTTIFVQNSHNCVIFDSKLVFHAIFIRKFERLHNFRYLNSIFCVSELVHRILIQKTELLCHFRSKIFIFRSSSMEIRLFMIYKKLKSWRKSLFIVVTNVTKVAWMLRNWDSYLKGTLSLSHLTFLDCNSQAALHLNTCLFLNIHDQNQISIGCKITWPL